MSDELLTIHDVAQIFRTTPGSIRTELWKYRRRGATLRFPLPISKPGELRWLKSAVDQYLAQLKQA